MIPGMNIMVLSPIQTTMAGIGGIGKGKVQLTKDRADLLEQKVNDSISQAVGMITIAIH